jgi:hypothetical protein
MNGAISEFLRESWKLFYRSLFFPSKLQERRNESRTVADRFAAINTTTELGTFK